jgi:thioredoxin
MQLKKISIGLLIVIISASIGWKLWQKPSVASEQVTEQIEGPAVILFKGDNSGDCRAIYKIVDDAERKYSDTINFIQTDWSEDNALIKKYQIRFLPTVVFVDQNNIEVERIVGEGASIEQKLKQRLNQVKDLSGH